MLNTESGCGNFNVIQNDKKRKKLFLRLISFSIFPEANCASLSHTDSGTLGS